MSTPRFVLVAALVAAPALAQGPNLGQPISEAEVKAWDISILPDGTGLPPGSGTPAQGERIYAGKCVSCHGEAGKGGTAGPLLGGGARKGIQTPKTAPKFWGDATKGFDFINR